MNLPIRTTVEDIEVVCRFLVTKPTGATLAEAKAVVDSKHVDGRKLTAFKIWGLIEDGVENKLKVTERGRQCVKDSGANRGAALRDVVRQVEPYTAAVERVRHRRNEGSIGATELAAHWHEHFGGEVSEHDKILNDQVICFFHIAQGADLGTLIVGRRGMPTRFDFDTDAIRAFTDAPVETQSDPITTDLADDTDLTDNASILEDVRASSSGEGVAGVSPEQTKRVFITHGKDSRILNQLKELVAYGKYEPVVALEHETGAKPVPEKVMDEMRTCQAAVIHVSTERTLYDKNGTDVALVNENVLIEIGAAMALYGNRFILLVEEGVNLPTNLQGLYECRYDGNELNMTATMKLLKAFSEF